MNTKYINYLIIFIFLILWRCEPNVDEFVPSAGNADFSIFVTVGDSYSAGYIDGALSYTGQVNSFPNIIATQMTSVGAGVYKQPMFPKGTSVGSSLNGSLVLKEMNGMLLPFPTEGNPELLTDPSTWINAEAPFNNVAVPGAKSFHLLFKDLGDPTLGPDNFNPFYARFASNPGTSTVIQDAMMNKPTFFSLWIGGNDVLWYGLGGGTGETSGTEATDITPESLFEYSISTLVKNLTSFGNGAKGVICNIPSIDALPYFSYIPYDNLVLTAEQAAALNKAYIPYNTAADNIGAPRIEFKEGRNPFVVSDRSYPLKIRQMKKGEKVLLSALEGIFMQGWGSKKPIPDEESLVDFELDNMTTATESFNNIIKQAAEDNDLAFVDANQIMEQLMNGIAVEGVNYDTGFVTGGFFSLDGIHASGRGYAIIANEFIKAINAKYNSTIPLANVNDYVGVEYP